MVAGVCSLPAEATIKAGEVTVEGRWQWGSGTLNADWILGGSLVDTGGDKLSQHMILMPAQQVEFLDTWHVSGLQGTGSTDYEVSNLALPVSHIVGYDGNRPPRTSLYQFPQFTLLAIGIDAVALGIARAAIDELVRLAQSKERHQPAHCGRPHPPPLALTSPPRACCKSLQRSGLSTVESTEAARTGRPDRRKSEH